MVEKAIATFKKTVFAFKELLPGGIGAERTPEILKGAVMLYKLENEIIRPGVMLILNHDRPDLPEYDSGKNSLSEGFAAYQPDSLMDKWATQRNATLAVLSALSADDMKREGLLPGGETITIESFVGRWADDEEKTVANLKELPNRVG